MNKQLLSFTALVAAGLLGASGAAVAQKKASKPTISIGGYTDQGVRFVDNGDGVGGLNTGGFGSYADSEIFFNISGQLDNGIKIGGRWELEGSGQSNDGTMDEHSIYFRGGFGELRLGEDDGAAQLMVTGYQGSWATSNGLNLAFDRAELVPAPAGFNNAGPAFSVRQDLADGDDTKITYITPKFGGFQIGASYARDMSSTSDAPIDQTATAGFEDWYSIGANFDRKFGNFRLGIAGSYLQMDSPIGSALGSKDPIGYGGGVLVEFGPVRIAGGFSVVEEWFPTAATSNEGESFDIGVRYSFGAHKIGLAYFTGQTDAAVATAGEDESSTTWVTHSMSIAPGVTWKNTVSFSDWDGEGAAATTDNDGWGAATHVTLNF